MFKSRYTDISSNDTFSSAVYHNVHHGGIIPIDEHQLRTEPAYCGLFQLFDGVEHGLGRENPCDNYWRSRNVSQFPMQFASRNLGGGTHVFIENLCIPSYWYNRQFDLSTNPSFGYAGLKGMYAISDVPTETSWDYDASERTSVLCFHNTDVSQLIDNSLLAMLPQIRPNLSLLNSIFELKDFKSLPEYITRVKGFIRHLDTLVKKRPLRTLQSGLKLTDGLQKRPGLNFQRSKIASLRELVKLVGSSHLQYSFAIAPLLADIKAFMAAVSGVEKKLRKLLDDNGKVLKKHYLCPLPAFPVGDTDESINIFDVPDQMFHRFDRKVRTVKSEFRATLSYKYELSDYQILHSKLLAYMDAFGYSWSSLPSIIWNALPWTFVVDWFVGISNFLSKFNKGNLAPRVNIIKYVYSLKVQRAVFINVKLNLVDDAWDGPSHALAGPYPVVAVSESSYKRRVGIPDYYRLIRSSGLDSREFSLTTSLLASRF